MGNENSGSVRNLVQAGVLNGDVHLHSQPVEVAPPEQLPPDPANFVDRVPARAELDLLLTESRSGRAGFVVVSGVHGVGKSALVAYWSNRVAEVFADGQVCFGFDLGRRSLDEAAEHCLRSLGVDGDRIPVPTDDKIAMLRTRTRGRKLLFCFDDVADLDEVAKLLPASGECVVLCTSHWDGREFEPDGVRPIRLTGLETEHALDYLRRNRIPVDAEPAAAAELVERCGRLPVALRLMTGLLRRMSWSISRGVRELSDERRVRRHFADVFPVLDLVAGRLPAAEAELYALLGVHRGAFPVGAIAALAGLPEDDAEFLLAELHRTCLVEENDQDQYLLHDLVGEHTSEAARALGPDRRDEALRRLVAWYRRQGAYADRMVTEPTRLRVIDEEIDGENPFTRDEALEWLKRERVNLVGMVRLAHESGWYVEAIALCDGPLWGCTTGTSTTRIPCPSCGWPSTLRKNWKIPWRKPGCGACAVSC